MILCHPCRHERDEREPEEQMQIRPEDLAVHAVRGVQHVMMVVPVDAEKDEAEHVAEKGWHDRAQRRQVGTVGRVQLEDHDRDQDGDHAVTERLEPDLAHRRGYPPAACNKDEKLRSSVAFRSETTQRSTPFCRQESMVYPLAAVSEIGAEPAFLDGQENELITCCRRPYTTTPTERPSM